MAIGIPIPRAANDTVSATVTDAQDPNSYYGKVLRLNDDGSAPIDNPFAGRPDQVRPGVGSRQRSGSCPRGVIRYERSRALGQQRLDLPAQFLIVLAGLLQEAIPPRGILFDSGVVDPFDCRQRSGCTMTSPSYCSLVPRKAPLSGVLARLDVGIGPISCAGRAGHPVRELASPGGFEPPLPP